MQIRRDTSFADLRQRDANEAYPASKANANTRLSTRNNLLFLTKATPKITSNRVYLQHNNSKTTY